MFLQTHLRQIRAEQADDTDNPAAAVAADTAEAAAQLDIVAGAAEVAEAAVPVLRVPVAVQVVLPAVPLAQAEVPAVVVQVVLPVVVPAVFPAVVVPAAAQVHWSVCRTGCRNWHFLHLYHIVNKTSNNPLS